MSRVHEDVGDDFPSPALTPRRHTYQFRALSRRTATYHKRHWKLDLCCLGLCPAYTPLSVVTDVSVSVIIAGALGIAVQNFSNLPSNNQTFLSQGALPSYVSYIRRCLLLECRYTHESLVIPESEYDAAVDNGEWITGATGQLSHRAFPHWQCLSGCVVHLQS